MHMIGVSLVLGLVSTGVCAPVLWGTESNAGNFNSPAGGTSYLKDQSQDGWAPQVGVGPQLVGGKLNLYGTSGARARHGLGTTADFSTTKSVYIGFTLIFTGADFSGQRGFEKLLEVGISYGELAVQAAGASDQKSVDLCMMQGASELSSSVNVPLNTPVRMLLSLTISGTKRKANLAWVSDVGGTVVGNSASFSSISSGAMSSLDVYTAQGVTGWMDDLMVGNDKGAVYVQAHAPEPATALMGAPLVAGMLMRRRRS